MTPSKSRIRPSVRFACRSPSAIAFSAWLCSGRSAGSIFRSASGFATIGAIGFEGRSDYAAIGTVTNLAARLCGEAKGGQIFTNRKTLSEIEHVFEAEPVGVLSLKGFARPVDAVVITGLKASAPMHSRQRSN